MLTPQEVSNRAFSKAVMGGYNMAMVDEFLDELTDDYTALYKENAALKAKMKVLVDKVEEYRETEDSMRAALLTAQKMANTMVQEAEQRKDELIADAEKAAREKLIGLQDEVALEQQRLNAAKAETARFVQEMRSVCEKEVAFLAAVPDLTPIEVEDRVKAHKEYNAAEIEEQIFASLQQDNEIAAAEEKEIPVAVEKEVSAADDAVKSKHTINLSELKFGRNYRGSSDED